MLLAMEALSAFPVLVNILSMKSKVEISTMYPCGKIHFIHIPYRTKLWRGENFGEFGESPQFAKFFSPTFPMKHENAGKPWIRQSFFRQCFKIIISPNFFTAKVLFYTVAYYFQVIACTHNYHILFVYIYMLHHLSAI